ncbi:hypothetical protein [Enterococcus dispar]|uniref:hypothetical protein n=1 Tax=Enterococcus dispar TaxID=44009 RepID=UPI00248F9201|nr:hypothetical protein [Enterococcus dispar]
MIKGVTESGFKYKLSEERLDNYELLESFAEMEESPLAMPRVLNLLLGKEQTGKLKEHVRTKDGFVPSDKLGAELQDIMLNNPKVKNS